MEMIDKVAERVKDIAGKVVQKPQRNQTEKSTIVQRKQNKHRTTAQQSYFQL